MIFNYKLNGVNIRGKLALVAAGAQAQEFMHGTKVERARREEY